MGKHDKKSSPIFMSLYCSYVCMHNPEKNTIQEPFTLDIWAAKDLTFCCGQGFVVTQIGEQLPWLTIL